MSTTATGSEPVTAAPSAVPFGAALRFWLKLGFISFGGPAGQIATMHTELVERKRWISERRFLHALNYCMVLPGPEATQLAVYIGWLLHGTLGGLVAGIFFILPSLFVLLGLSWVYVVWGDVPALQGIFWGVKPAVVAIVANAVLRIGRRSIRNIATLGLAVAAFVAMQVRVVPFPMIIVGAGLLGFLGSKFRPAWFTLGGPSNTASDRPHAPTVINDNDVSLPHTRPSWRRFVLHLSVGLFAWLGPLVLLAWLHGWPTTATDMALFFTETAFLTFGGAYAVLPFVTDHALSAGWLRAGQMIDGLALGETTPGPLIMIVAFVGFVGGWQTSGQNAGVALLTGVVATYFTFLPSFLFILLGAPFIEQMRGEIRLTAALTGITAAVVGVILNLAVFFGLHVAFPAPGVVDWPALFLAGAAFLALWRFKVDLIPVVGVCGVLGLFFHGGLVSWR